MIQFLKKLFTNPQPKGETMDFSQLIQMLQDLQTKLADAQAFAKENYDKGFADGVASVPPPPPPSEDPLQAQLDAANAQIADLQQKMADMQVQVDGFPAQIAAAIAQGVAQENARILAIVQAEEADLLSKIQPQV